VIFLIFGRSLSCGVLPSVVLENISSLFLEPPVSSTGWVKVLPDVTKKSLGAGRGFEVVGCE
jgi:hypothetical protein